MGHTFYEYDRHVEQQDMLRQIKEIVRQRKPDLFLLCGDVFHTSQPSAYVQKMLVDALTEIHNLHPEMTIVMTSGNHDSATRHEVFRSPWKEMRIHAVGMIDKENPDSHIIEVPGQGIVIAVPYVHERNMPEGFIRQLLDTANSHNTEGLPVILTAHTSVSGFDFKGHEDVYENSVGGIEYISLEEIGEGYDYLALGHIHHAQTIKAGRKHARYCGSPLPISFDETYPHSVTWIEIESHDSKPEISEIILDNIMPIFNLPTEGFMPWENVRELLESFPDDIKGYVRLNVEVEDFLPPGAHAEALEIVKHKKCKFCHINTRRIQEKDNQPGLIPMHEFRQTEPLDLVKKYAEDSGIGFDEELEDLFKDALNRSKEII